jgi:hypothetical protein
MNHWKYTNCVIIETGVTSNLNIFMVRPYSTLTNPMKITYIAYTIKLAIVRAVILHLSSRVTSCFFKNSSGDILVIFLSNYVKNPGLMETLSLRALAL